MGAIFCLNRLVSCGRTCIRERIRTSSPPRPDPITGIRIRELCGKIRSPEFVSSCQTIVQNQAANSAVRNYSDSGPVVLAIPVHKTTDTFFDGCPGTIIHGLHQAVYVSVGD